MNLIKKVYINNIISHIFIPNRLRSLLLKLAGMDLATNKVRANCYFDSTNISIGKGTFINYFCQFYPSISAKIEIGENCDIAMNVNMCTISHEKSTSSKRAGKNTYSSIKIGDGVWIGANTVILQGVNISNGCIIAAGSVVVSDCEPNYLYGGVPAKKLKKL